MPRAATAFYKKYYKVANILYTQTETLRQKGYFILKSGNARSGKHPSSPHS